MFTCENWGEAVSFSYLGSLASSGGNLSDELSFDIQKAQLTFIQLRHLSRQHDIRLPITLEFCVCPQNHCFVVHCSPMQVMVGA